MVQRILMIVLILIIVLGGGFFAYKELMPPVEEEVEGPVYSTKEVVRGDITVGVETMGTLEPSRHGGIRVPGDPGNPFSVQAVIAEYLFEEGDEVKQGQVVARLESPDLRTQIETKQEELEAKKEQLEDLTNMSYEELKNTNLSNGITISAPIAGRVTNLEVQEGDKIEQGQTIARIVDDSKFIIEAKLFEAEYKIVEEGQKVLLRFPYFDDFMEGTITKINHNRIPFKEEDKKDYATGFAYQVWIEGKNKGLIQTGMNVEVGIKRDNGILYFSNTAKVEEYAKEEKIINTLEAVVTDIHVDNMALVEKGDPIITMAGTDVQEMMQERVDEIRELEIELMQMSSQMDMLEVKAPMNGIVAGFYRAVGESVRPGQHIGSLFTVEDMRMWCEVDDIDVLNVQQGAKVEIKVDALVNQKFEGEVAHVSTMGKQSSGIPKFGVEIRVKGGPDLRPGMQAHAFIQAGSAEDVLLVPIEAVFEEDGKTMVEVLNEDGSTKIVPVKLGLMNERVAEVKSGLKEGDLVVTGSSYDLLPSQHIKSQNGILPEKKDSEDNTSDDNVPQK